MYSRIISRQARSVLAVSRVRGVPSRAQSSEASSRPLGRKEKAHEDQYARQQEEAALKKMKEHLNEVKKTLAEMEAHVEKKEKK